MHLIDSIGAKVSKKLAKLARRNRKKPRKHKGCRVFSESSNPPLATQKVPKIKGFWLFLFLKLAKKLAKIFKSTIKRTINILQH